MQNIETFTRRVKAYAMRVERKRMKSNEKYIESLLDYGVNIAEKMLIRIAKVRKYEVRKIIR